MRVFLVCFDADDTIRRGEVGGGCGCIPLGTWKYSVLVDLDGGAAADVAGWSGSGGGEAADVVGVAAAGFRGEAGNNMPWTLLDWSSG